MKLTTVFLFVLYNSLYIIKELPVTQKKRMNSVVNLYWMSAFVILKIDLTRFARIFLMLVNPTRICSAENSVKTEGIHVEHMNAFKNNNLKKIQMMGELF
jgi:hypothetical protein